MGQYIDLRSDTVTKPTKGMLQAMLTAQVGDDVFGDDPTVHMLEEKAAALFGMKVAMFCPSGTMTNQIAIKVHTSPGDEVICEEGSHVYRYEGGGIGLNSGASVRPVRGDRGRITAEQVLENINPHDVHQPVSKVVVVENTANRGGGSCYSFSELEKISAVCRMHNLKLHLDGARLFNALEKTGESTRQVGKLFDSISICLSKGLGAPVGSLLIGDLDFIIKGRRIRKVFGGAMRQAGYLAAAGIYALDHNIARLKEDRLKAQALEDTLVQCSFIEEVMPVETNIIIIRLNTGISQDEFLTKLENNHILAVGFGPRMIRFVTHLDISDAMLEKTRNVLKRISL